MSMWIPFALAGALALLLHKTRPELLVVAYVGAFIFIPPAELIRLTGTEGPLHILPATWMALIALALSLILDGTTTVRLLSRKPTYQALLLLAIIMSVHTAVLGARFDLVTNQILGPIVIILFVMKASSMSQQRIRTIVLSIIAFSCLLAVAVFAELFSQQYLFFHEANAQQYSWYQTDGFDRPFGTTSHPLVAAFIVSCTIPLITQLRRLLFQVGAAVILFSATLACQARTALVVSTVALIYLIFASRLSLLARAALSILTAAFATFVLLNTDEFVTLTRLDLADRSTQLREAAYSWFFLNWASQPAFGNGMGSGYLISDDVGLGSSFESFGIQMVLDFGVPLTAIFFLIIGVLIFYPAREVRLSGTRVAAIAAILQVMTFSSLNVQTATGPVLFVLIGLATVYERTATEGNQVFSEHHRLAETSP